MGKIPPERRAQRKCMVTSRCKFLSDQWIHPLPWVPWPSRGACCRSRPVWPTGGLGEGSDDCRPPHRLTARAFSWKKCSESISLNSHSSECLHWQTGFSVHLHGWAGLHQGKSCFPPLNGNNPQHPRYCQAAGERREEQHIMTWISVLNHCAASSRYVWPPKWALEYTPWLSPDSMLAWDLSTHRSQVPWFPQKLKPCDRQEPY